MLNLISLFSISEGFSDVFYKNLNRTMLCKMIESLTKNLPKKEES